MKHTELRDLVGSEFRTCSIGSSKRSSFETSTLRGMGLAEFRLLMWIVEISNSIGVELGVDFEGYLLVN